MTYKEKFDNETNWRHRVLIVELFHLKQQVSNPGWRILDSAKSFGRSIALISENLELAKHVREGKFDSCPSREKAIKILRKERK